MTRHLPFEGIENFRDFGDYPTAAGLRLKRGRLYRSAAHGRATDADLEAVAALDLAVVVDLRRRSERVREPSRRHTEFAATVIESDLGDREEDPWHAFIRESDLSPAAFSGYMRDYYRAAPFEERHLDLFARYFRALAEADGPVLIHCAAGKDRTGILAALTHHVAGVHRDDIVADYLLTNDPRRIAMRLPMVTKVIEEASGRTPSQDAILTAMGVEAEYLEIAFAAIEARHGSVEAYVSGALGVDAPLRERLEARLFD